MDFRKQTRGENALKKVPLVIAFYDNGVAPSRKEPGKVGAYFGSAYGHPDASIGKNQTNLALLTERKDVDGEKRYNHSTAFYPEQMEAIKAAAGDNTAPLLDKEGNRRGTIYGVTADLMSVKREIDGEKKAVGFMPNTKTLAASEFSVAEVDGKTINQRIFESERAAVAARDAKHAEAKQIEPVAEAAAEAEAETEVESEQPIAAEEPELV
ncbi:hypothetical protein [Arthrobacter bambusae]|uniref:Uncharacterized protein n=1 Tax=Arthrobacter bambusae TaxID=1338426 RepID=A0AAW8D988_9MICC|nr:hypothetical protein [Arthrobacter bambusae]MDP9903199.1 hypothetical protein [Arthrobacter bambusae]MDQ0128807.1 hypothetical protein [Arthrobacter bambusae]MDQ0180148.1 hypothetical protein [Arthrobacter bambusae]